MKQGRKLKRKHKEFLAELNINCEEYLLERDTSDENGKYFRIINIKTGEVSKFYY